MDKNKILKNIATGLGKISNKIDSLENKVLSKVTEENDILSSKNHFNDYIQYKVINKKKTECYPSSNIGLVLDKDTNEITWCIHSSSLKGLLKECYNLETRELVLYENIGIKAYNKEFKKLVRNSYIFDMRNINNYLNDTILKDSYTYEELKELEPNLTESILIMNEFKPNQKIHKK